jgi:hypothetical protein
MSLGSRFFSFLAIAALWALPASAQQSGALDRTLSTGNAKVFELEASAAELQLTPSADADGVRVRIDQDSGTALPQLQTSRTGNRFAMSIVPPSNAPLIPFAQGAPAKYNVTYPARMRLDLRISSGDVHIVNPSSAVEIYDNGGNITVDDPRTSITAESARGNVTVNHALAPIDLAADAGDVTADLANGWSGDQIRVQAAAGTIRLAVPPSFRARFDASTESGTVHNALDPQGAKSPFVWLYALKGDIYVTVAKP